MARLISGTSLTTTTFESSLSVGAAECDLSRLRFVDAYGLVGASVVLTGAAESQFQPKFVPPEWEATAEHLTYMGMSEIINETGIDSTLPDKTLSVESDMVVPVQIVRDWRVLEDISRVIFEQLNRVADSQVRVALAEAISELGANALQHSREVGIATAQLYRRGEDWAHDGTIQVVVGDSGRGIRASFDESPRFHPENDLEAIDIAVSYLASSLPDVGRGQGLTTTIEEVTGLSGQVSVRSGSGCVVFDRSGARKEEVFYLRGTIVGIVIPIYPGAPASC